MKYINRLLNNFTINDITGCWEWNKSTDSWGYGLLWDGVNMKKTHRLSYEYHNKTTIPKGMYICHTCDNPLCINPDHLWLGTPEQNSKDRDTKGRTGNNTGELNPAAKLTKKQIKLIRIESCVTSQKELATKYNVSVSLINQILNYKVWKNVN